MVTDLDYSSLIRNAERKEKHKRDLELARAKCKGCKCCKCDEVR